MEPMFFFAVGWGLGIAVGIYLSKLIWFQEDEDVWVKHKRNQKMINEAVQKELQKVK